MGLFELLIAVLVLGLIVWVIETVVPLPQPFITVIRVIAVVILIIFLLRFAGLARY